MTNRNALKHAVRHALIVGAISAATGATSMAADEATLDKVVVTGSRIASDELTSASPVQIVSHEDIQASGVANIQDLLLKNPAVGSPTLSRTNSNFLTSSAGVSTIDLRDLGTSRTLVLVNGRRFVAGIPGESAVDLNAIPVQFIERVEVLTGGSSAVYGSDAVAGVVNIIYKKHFEGIEVAAQYGEAAAGDGEDTQFSITMGTNVADGRGNIMVHLGYTNQGPVYSKDRDRSAIDQNSLAATTNQGEDVFTVVRPFYSGFAPQGSFFTDAGTYTYNAQNQLITGFSTNGTATRAADGFNRSAFRTIAVPTERYIAALQGDYAFSDHHSAFVEGTYVSTKTTSELEPFPLASDAIYPATFGQVPIEFATYTPDPANPGSYQRTVLRNPLVPTAIYNGAGDDDGDGLRDIYFRRRLTDIGARGNTANRGTFRILGGLRGSLGESTWNYEGFYSFGETTESQVSSGQVNVLNFRNALEAVPDVNDVNNNGNTTEAICRDDNARAQGCVPANIYGYGALSPAAVNYIKAPGLLATYTSQNNLGLNVTGELFDLPAGAVGLSLGAEYRKEFARSEFDPLQQAGLNAGNAIPRTEGQFSVKEGYTEIRIPILKDVLLAEHLDFNGAYRYSDYTTTGGGDTWNVGLEWTPWAPLKFRFTSAQSTRAPNINELYSPPSQTFPSVSDPCVNVTATSTSIYAAGCRAAPGVNANIAANGSFLLTQADLQGVSGYDRGNPNAKDEVGHSLILGVVFTPTDMPVLKHFTFTADYFDIKVDDALVSTDRSFILQQCYSGGNTSMCQFITRRPTAAGALSAGSLEFVDSGVTNSGTLETEGIDITVGYAQNLADWGLTGDFGAHFSITHLMNAYTTPLPGSPQNSFAGEVGSPYDSALLTLSYTIGGFNVYWSATYLGESKLDDQYVTTLHWGNGAQVQPGQIGVGAVVYHDVQFKYTFNKMYDVYLGGHNVFDKGPPPIISGLPGDVTGTETDAGTYDAIGRQWYAGVRVKF